ncbi:MAG: hypothetical protein L3J67_13465 [Hyphomicrobiaceae bacterium]|nr:hypothetical protein [Hyphomicrobiaceae bacterium]
MDKPDRQQRLAEQLRANLKKRKHQRRDRGAEQSRDKGSYGGETVSSPACCEDQNARKD